MSSFRGFFNVKPYHGFASLQPGKYKIIKFSMVANRFAANHPEDSANKTTIKAELEDQILYLPNYLTEKMKEDPEMVNQINNSGIQFYLHFYGKKTENG